MKIDFVITWVDGTDPEWLQEKRNYLPNSSLDANRYRDWELLKYWFRGVEKFAPWVNKVHFITWGHVPSFLNIDHPKLNIVNHKDYLKDDYLPTFNSNAIELSMHKIKNLSEHFVYFNDDMFIIKDVKKNDFFEQGLPKDVAVLNPIIPKSYGTISGVMLNNMGIINQNFNFRSSFKKNWAKWLNLRYKTLLPLNILFLPWNSVIGLYQQHLPSSFLKSTMEEVWNKEYEVLDETSRRKERDNRNDVNQWLFKKWLVMQGKFKPRNIDFGKYIMIENMESLNKFKKAKRKKTTKIVCLNDHVDKNLDNIIKEIINEFEEILDKKSTFEKD